MNDRLWSQSEIDASVAAYLEMLRKEISGEKYNKAEVNRDLRAGALLEQKRSRGSVEMRMCNISSVLDDQGKRYIDGYKPRGNVGENVYPMIEAALEKFSIPIKPTPNYEDLDRFVEIIRERNTTYSPPVGNLKPKIHREIKSEVVERCPFVKRWVLDEANGVCELCLKPAPFFNKSRGNPPFLEVHHVIPLKDGGPDTVCNAVALCPNCHRRCHHGVDYKTKTQLLYTQVQRLKVPGDI